MSTSEASVRESITVTSKPIHSNHQWSKAKMVLSVVVGLVIPQLCIVNYFPFDGGVAITSTDYYLTAPLYVIYIGWSSPTLWRLVLSALPAPLVWPVAVSGTLSVIQALVALPVAVSVWRTGTGHGKEELIKATTLMNTVVLLLLAIGSLMTHLAVFFVPIFPGMAIVGFYYVWKAKRT